jgi:pimeloyl-ACP methyl ester carboxylesterase
MKPGMAPIEKFRTSDWEQQARMLADPTVARDVEQWMGPDAFAELQQLRGSVGSMAAGTKNLIVAPGIMGSMLQSEGLGGIWWVDMLRARDKLDGLALKPGGEQDRDEGANILPASVDVTYAPLRAAIIESRQFGGSTPFPYDWRKSPRASAEQLRDLVAKVYADYGEPVHLVGHSMGGLIIRTALMQYGADMWPKIGKIVFIATPHYGSPSIAGYLKNQLWGWEPLAVIGAFLSRDTFRSMWGALSLLPAPSGVYPGTRNGEPHPCANFDLYDARAYRLDLAPPALEELQRGLDAARALHKDLFDWHSHHLSSAQRAKMLQICGVGRKTLFRLEIGNNWLGLWKDVEKVTDRIPGDPNREGDGRVPVASGALENIEVRYVSGEHGSLENVASVVRDVLAWLDNRAPSLPDSPAAALSGHLAAPARSPAPHLDGSAGLGAHDDDYDRYRDIPDARVRELVAKVYAGDFPGIDFVRIL